MNKILTTLLVLVMCSFAGAEESSCPHHSDHHKQVDERGDRVMGFDHMKTAHHFQLKADGGVILAESKAEADSESIEKIRKHFVEIRDLFARGEFSIPEEVHGEMPPGATAMSEYKSRITYSFHELSKGAEVRIQTKDPEALKAIHSFLRYQIEEHRTGDSLSVR